MTKEFERSIIENFRKGDPIAFKEIYEETKEFVYNIIYRMIFDKEETKDLMQDIYIKIFENRTRYNEAASAFQTWLYRIAFNHTLNFVNRRKMILTKQLALADKETKVEEITDVISDKEESVLLQKLLLKIKPKHRLCIVLCDIEKLSYEQIAARLGINIGTVRSRLNRGRKELAGLYRKEVRVYELQKQ